MTAQGDLQGFNADEIESILSYEYELEYAAVTRDLALSALEEVNEYGGADVLFPKGYDAITEHLAKGLDVELNQPIQNIDYRGDSVVVTSRSSRTWKADLAIVTVPLGVLKKDLIEFSPRLSEEKRKAISSLGYRLMNKLYLEFPQPFWDADVDVICRVAQTKGRRCLWYNLNSAIERPILVSLVAGDFTEQMELWSGEDVVQDAIKVLPTIYGQDVPTPTGSLITRWRQDPFSFGSYSYLRASTTSDLRRDLAEPVDGKLFFAGEATEFDYPATVHGAYHSGLREARRIRNLLKP